MIKKLLLISTMFAGGTMITANATPLLSFTPSVQPVVLGGQASVDVILSGLEDGGLNEALSAYDLTVAYNAAILDVNSSNFLNLGNTTADTSVGGQISWNDFSTLSDTELQNLQGNSLTLASIVFNTLSVGSSALSFSFTDLTGLANSAGAPQLLNFSSVNGSITVSAQNSTVPEPAAILLIGLGALGLAKFKKS